MSGYCPDCGNTLCVCDAVAAQQTTDDAAFERDELAAAYQAEVFKNNPDGFTIAPYCNADHSATAFEAGWDACHKHLSERLAAVQHDHDNDWERIQNAERTCDHLRSLVAECTEALESARGWVSTHAMQTYSRVAAKEVETIDELLAKLKSALGTTGGGGGEGG